ncbi:hypothetical protein [Vallitalea guaymasensis]|uniref:hypothetical protein n=1 Tax=Vallitalea guaymasensis TaxID=1185412 RepID=UPI00235476C9|nr:hypothetical protein [Vallitalea guaymasensis]
MNYKRFTDVELLREVLLERKGTCVAEALLNEYGSLPDAILNCSNNEIKYLEVNGLGIRRKAQIMAIQELVNRLMTVDYGRGDYRITCPSDVTKLLMNELKFKNREEAWIMC